MTQIILTPKTPEDEAKLAALFEDFNAKPSEFQWNNVDFRYHGHRVECNWEIRNV